jgi:hypothetical protein
MAIKHMRERSWGKFFIRVFRSVFLSWRQLIIVDRADRLANREDEDVSEALHQLCHDEGIDLVMNA